MYDFDLTGFTPYVPEELGQWVNALEEYYGQELPKTYHTQWYYGPRERILEECSSENAAACVRSNGNIVMTERYKESCLIGAHELMHLAMRDVYGEGDGDHSRDDWHDVWEICGSI
jgi:hypothetical protein